MATRLLSSTPFASLLVYAPQGQGDVARRSRTLRDQVKNDRGGVIALGAQRIRERWDDLGFEEFLGPEVLLVPAPRSSPLKDPRALWPPRRVCEELVLQNLGVDWSDCLERTEAVPKSAFAPKGERPTAAMHLASIVASPNLALPEHSCITVVDDFVTTGSTLLASASHLAEVFAPTPVRCFALVRVQSGDDVELRQLIDAVKGTVRYYDDTGRTTRRP